MVRRFARFSGLTAALAWASIASAGPVTLTGNLGADFPALPAPAFGPHIQQDRLDDVIQPPWELNRGTPSGTNIEKVALSYDDATDTLFGAAKFVGIAGVSHPEGNSDVSNPNIPYGIEDVPHLGGQKTISFAFGSRTGVTNLADPNDAGWVISAGVPSLKPNDKPGVDYFTVAKYKYFGTGLGNTYGEVIDGNKGSLAFDPSKEHPDFEFAIRNFNKISGINAADGLTFRVFAGTGSDLYSEDIAGGRTSRLAPQAVPEPATITAWMLAVGGAAVAARRRKGRSVA